MEQSNNLPDIELGRVNLLPLVKQVEFGYYLAGAIRGQREEILLPRGEVLGDISQKALGTPDGGLGDRIPVFIYLDQEERLIATMRQPLAEVGRFACLEVAWVNNFGAFLHWGLQKDLFVPFREQKQKMQKGRRYIVHVHLDPETYRIIASAKVEKWLINPLDSDAYDYSQRPRVGDEVECLVWQKTDLGFKVIVNNTFAGLLYESQIFRELHTGDVTRAFISKVREDGKIDLTLQQRGQKGVEDFSSVLLEHISKNGGYTPMGDKSPAEEIASIFGVSKKVFKKAVGDLYRQRLITIQPDGLHLV